MKSTSPASRCKSPQPEGQREIRDSLNFPLRQRSPEFFLRRQQEIKSVMSQKPAGNDQELMMFDDMKVFSRPNSPPLSHKRVQSPDYKHLRLPILPQLNTLASDLHSE